MTGIYKLYWDCGYFYIGQADSIKKRVGSHLYQLGKGIHTNNKLQNVATKHGLPSFEIVCECPSDQLTATEQHYIDLNLSDPKCCNLSPTAGSCLGFKQGEHHRNRCRERMLSDQNPTKGVGHTDEARKKMSASHTGKKLTQIHAERIHAQIRGEKHGKAKTVIDTATGLEYGCILHAAIAANMNYRTFKNQVNGSKRNKTTFILKDAA